MDLGVILGLVIAVVSILGANMLEGGHVGDLFQLTAMLIIIGGTVGATMVHVGLTDFLRIPALFMGAMKKHGYDRVAIVEQLVSFAQKARREGMLALEEDLQGMNDEFMAKGLQMMVDGIDPEMVEGVLMTETELHERQAQADASIFEAAGGYGPTMGIIGTVMGLIHVLGNLENPDELGPAIAVAFLATLWGILTANIFWLPVAGKMKVNARELSEVRHLVMEGILSIQKGESPGMVKEKLEAFIIGYKPKGKEGKAQPGMEATGKHAEA